MRSVFDFLIKPVGERYNNKVDVDGKELIINTKIETFKSVNKLAEVVATPLAFETDIKPGDIIVVHHNVFRRFYSLDALKINRGDLVGYTPFGEFEFLIDGERLYCMKSNDIVIKYEYKGDEAEYNPSWASSS